jgi:hypothetical protein
VLEIEMDYSSRNLSNEDRLFQAVPPSRPPVSGYTVVGGRIVAYSQGHFPVNGQQLMMQLDSLTSLMMDMNVSMEDKMEVIRSDETESNRESTQSNKDANKSHQQQQHEHQMMQQQQYELQLQQYQLQQQQQFHQEQQQQDLPFSHKYLS